MVDHQAVGPQKALPPLPCDVPQQEELAREMEQEVDADILQRASEPGQNKIPFDGSYGRAPRPSEYANEKKQRLAAEHRNLKVLAKTGYHFCYGCMEITLPDPTRENGDEVELVPTSEEREKPIKCVLCGSDKVEWQKPVFNEPKENNETIQTIITSPGGGGSGGDSASAGSGVSGGVPDRGGAGDAGHFGVDGGVPVGVCGAVVLAGAHAHLHATASYRRGLDYF
jgi:hypothetical protein